MRLDWFLPAIRKSKTEEPAHRTGLSPLRSWLPAAWRSDHQTKRRGTLRRWLRCCGPSWLQSPLRRGVQVFSLVSFLWLFFYVCWPYTAQPAPPAPFAVGWKLEEFTPETGALTLVGPEAPAWLLPGATVHLVDSPSQQTIGRFHLQDLGAPLSLTPIELSPELVEALLLSSGDLELFAEDPARWPSHYADDLAAKEWVGADLFLVIDPLVSLSTAIAARRLVWSLSAAAVILVVCLVVPRGFCGYLCPLGTLIDGFDWLVGRHITRFRVPGEGWWVHIKYYLLLGSLLCAAGGVLVTGYVAAIPVVTRGVLMLGEPLRSGFARGWHLVPVPGVGTYVSLALFLGVLGLGLLQPRFWCKYVCPSGALFSLGNLFRVSERKVESSCIHCNKCIEVCPFDAIKPDFTTRVTDCTLCQTCGGVCPTHAIKFVERNNVVELKLADDPPTGETSLGRRGFLAAAVGSAAAVGGALATTGFTQRSAQAAMASDWLPVRPPGSVPEEAFLQMCIRCGECFKACPNNVLQPMSLEQGLVGLWTPHVVADWAGCESSCNACGQVCPTGAIRALPLEEKRHARMGLAIVNEATCLPFAGREACQLCVDECNAAGYEAIEFTQVHTQVDEQGNPVADTGYLAPVVLPEKCVGCGLCQTRCFGINVDERGVLAASAIIIESGDDYEDRLFEGSYASAARARRRDAETRESRESLEFYVPPTGDPEVQPAEEADDDPFGL